MSVITESRNNGENKSYLLEVVAESSLQELSVFLEEPQEEVIEDPDWKAPRLSYRLVSDTRHREHTV